MGRKLCVLMNGIKIDHPENKKQTQEIYLKSIDPGILIIF